MDIATTEEIKKSFELMKDMNYNFKNEIMNTPVQLDSSIKNLCYNIEALSNKIDEKANNSMNDLSNKLIELTNYFESVINSSRK